ncbi:unnamed protein product, partial [Rotaria sordida]
LCNECFNQLHTFYVNILRIQSSNQIINNTEKSSKLKCFPLSYGIFKCVRKILLFDEYPFEHEFILQISKSFPFLEKLTIVNRKR